MADDEHLEILRQGVDRWNEWRSRNPDVRPDLRRARLNGARLRRANLNGADLTGAQLRETDLTAARLLGADLSGSISFGTILYLPSPVGANLRGATLTRANLSGARLRGTRLYGADLRGATLTEADLTGARLGGADLRRANLRRANLTRANLVKADLTAAKLSGATLVETRVARATLSQAQVYGASVWSLQGMPTDQTGLVITRRYEPVVTIDDLEVAQFVYMLINNEKLKGIIDSVSSKVVLILGRFTPERKRVLDALRERLRNHNLTPVLFDFDIPRDRDITETVTLLARLARFIIADLTDPRSIPQELQAIVPDLAVPVQAIILSGQEPWTMFPDLRKYHWMLQPHQYRDDEELLADLETKVIAPADAKRDEINAERAG